MTSIRAAFQAAVTGLGVLVVAFGVSVAASIETPPGGGDIPTGFATLFSWALVAVGVVLTGIGLVLLDDTGLGAYLERGQRRLVRAGGALLLAAALLPFVAVLLLPVLFGLVGPGTGRDPNAVLSNALLAWLALVGLGGLGVLSGVGWRLVDALRERFDDGIPGQ